MKYDKYEQTAKNIKENPNYAHMVNMSTIAIPKTLLDDPKVRDAIEELQNQYSALTEDNVLIPIPKGYYTRAFRNLEHSIRESASI